jgi:hypothetical protein
MVRVKVVEVDSKVKDTNLRRQEPKINGQIANLYALSKYLLVITDIEEVYRMFIADHDWVYNIPQSKCGVAREERLLIVP